MKIVPVAAALTMLAIASSAIAAGGAGQYLNKPDDWFRGDEGRRVVAVVLSYQSPGGGWPKNTDTTAAPYTGDPAKLQGTFDNSATTGELRLLARAYNATNDGRCKDAFLCGVDHVLKAQYPTGGWPQSYPPDAQYHRHITFNDNAMVRLMGFLREVRTADAYAFVDADRRAAAGRAFDRGIEYILKCQIKVDGKLTAWCAQHDEKDYAPRAGRTFELVSLSGSESVGIVRLLMSLDRPTPEVIRAVDAAAAWMESAKLAGIRQIEVADEKGPKGKDRRVVPDPVAPPLWARFYEIGTNRPIFADRDGVAKHELSQIGYERRNGYAWLGDWPRPLLEREYPAWKKRVEISAGRP